mgnify:CR=1 FL=1
MTYFLNSLNRLDKFKALATLHFKCKQIMKLMEKMPFFTTDKVRDVFGRNGEGPSQVHPHEPYALAQVLYECLR